MVKFPFKHLIYGHMSSASSPLGNPDKGDIFK